MFEFAFAINYDCFQFALFVAIAAVGVTQISAAPLRDAFRFREAIEEAPGVTGGATGATGITGVEAAPAPPAVPKENPIIAAYKEKMELCEVQCNDAKSLTFNASEALNTSIAVVQKFMSSAAEEVAEAKKSEAEEGGATTLESLTNSQRHASDAKHERKF